MKQIIISYVLVLVLLLILDGAWLSIMGKRFFTKQIGHLMGDSVNWGPAVIFYLIYALVLTVLIILPGLKYGASGTGVLLSGALFGLAAYATYDLTNWATLRNWSALMTIVDMAWGTFMTGVATSVTVKILQWWK